MAAYPTYPQLLATTDDAGDGGVVVDRAQDGSARARSFFPSTKRAFALRHLLTPAERAALLAFYETNKTFTVTLNYRGDGVTYTVLFTAAPKFAALGGMFDADVRLVEV